MGPSLKSQPQAQDEPEPARDRRSAHRSAIDRRRSDLDAGAWIDISLAIEAGSVPWSGLRGPRLSWEAQIDRGDAVNVGRLELSLHTATHADAPRHVMAEGADIASVDVTPYLGEVLLVRVADVALLDRSCLASAGVQPGGDLPSRLLVATDRPFDGRRFPETVIHLAPEAARWLMSLGIRLIGLDQPSVDPLDSKQLESHHILLGGGARIIENLDLRGIPAGRYDLVAVPLRIPGADASPVRALLRRRPTAGEAAVLDVSG
jgi:arylformamidase